MVASLSLVSVKQSLCWPGLREAARPFCGLKSRDLLDSLIPPVIPPCPREKWSVKKEGAE